MRRVRWISYFLAAFVLGGGALLACMHRMGLFEVLDIPIEFVASTTESAPLSRGARNNEARLKARLEGELKPIKGKRIWDVDLGHLRASLERDEWVKDVLISRSLPNMIRVRVRPRSAALILVSKQNQFIPVAENGALLSAVPPESLPDAPFLRGDVFADSTEQGLKKREEAVSVLASLNETGLLSRKNISEVSWTASDGYQFILLQPHVEVKLGDERVELKAMRAGQVLNYLSANNLKGRVIDASFSKKVLVRLRKGP